MLVTAILLLVASMFTAFYCDQVRMYKIVAFAIVYGERHADTRAAQATELIICRLKGTLNP